MKTFSTNGTGNQQTLSEIESDKVPVYDSVADAEADLANLSVGQIGTTKDTGTELSQPVDVVQSGNLHAVTSNAVAECLSYSTTEHKTGRKWIDGKDTYEKVVTSIYNVTTTSAEYRDTGAVLPTFNKLIKCKLIGDLANVLYYSNESGSTVKIASLGTFQISAGAQFNLEYTKTTD